MSNCYENERQKRREQYLLSSKNPGCCGGWSIQSEVYSSTGDGEDSSGTGEDSIGKKREEYDVEPLIRHAEHVRETERSFVKRAFTNAYNHAASDCPECNLCG